MDFSKFLVFFFIACFFLQAFAVSAPVVSSTTHPDQEKWYGSPAAYVSWAAVEGASNYAYAYDSKSDTIPDSAKTTASISLTLGAKSDGIYYFHVKSSGAVSSDTAHYKIQIDTRGPSRPEVKATTQGQAILLEWSGSEDALSGIKGYEIYRNNMTNFSIKDLGVRHLGFYTGNSLLDENGMEQGRTYFYKIAPVDNAGNSGVISAQFQATIATYCDLNIVLNPRLSDDKKMLLVSVSAALPIYYSTLLAELPNSEKAFLFRDKSNYTSWDANLDLNSTSQGIIKIVLKAQEFYGDNCDTNKEFVFDLGIPELEFVFPKNYREEIQGLVKIKLQVSDTGEFKSGIEKAALSYKQSAGFIQLGNARDENGFYALDWNVSNLQNGYYILKAVATDKAGNSVEKTKEVFVFNTAGLTQDANALIAAAMAELENLEAKNNLLSYYGVDSNSLASLRKQGLAELDSARQALKERLFDEAKSKANTAKRLFAQAESSVDLNIVASDDFIFNKQQVQLLLEAAKLSPELIPNAALLIRQSKVSRQLKVLKIKDANGNFFKVGIFVSFDFSQSFLEDNNISSVQVVEIIPKDFAENASQLYSAYDFNVLEQGPKISFLLPKSFFDSNKQLVYTLKESFSKESDAIKFVNNSTVNKFIAPPVLLSSQSGLPVLQAGEFPLGAILAIIAVIIIVFVAIAIIARLKSKKRGF